MQAGFVNDLITSCLPTIRPEDILPPLVPHGGAKANAVQRTGQNLHTTCYNIRMRLHDYAPRPAHLKWLLDSDRAIRWQVMMFKIMLEKHGMYSYAHTNQHTHGANRQYSKTG
jgi:hypothetical protein